MILISGLFISGHFPTASSTCIFGANGKPTSCNSGPYIMTSYPPPLQQVESGIPANDIQCKQDLELIFKAENGSPACVKPNTAQKLNERGWAHNTLSHSAHTIISMQTMNVTNSNLSVNYTITNAKILDIKADKRDATIIISMQTSGDGNLNIVIPRTLVEYPNQTDPHLFVLGNGQEIDSREINTTSNERTLSIPFKADINQIEIIGAVCCT